MNGLIQYILTVTAAAILVAILQNLAGTGTMGALVKLVAGIFMAYTVIAPVMRLDMPDMEQWLSNCSVDGRAAAATGEEIGNEALRTIIKEKTEAYILDKAAGYSASLEVRVTLDEEGMPAAVTLTGAVSPYAKASMAQIIASDLGVGEEAQEWIS